MLLSESKASLLDRVGGNTRFWKDRERNYAINEALCLHQALTGARYLVFPYFTQSGVGYYNTPRQIVSLQRVSYNGVPLQDTSVVELDLLSPGWETVPGTPTQWAPIGLTMFALAPIPNASGILILEGIAAGGKTFAEGQELEVGDEELLRIQGYAHHYLTIKEGTVELQDTVQAVQHLLEAAVETNMRSAAVAAASYLAGLPKDEAEVPSRAPAGPGARSAQ